MDDHDSDTEQPVQTFKGLLAQPDLAAATRAQVESDLESARADKDCQ